MTALTKERNTLERPGALLYYPMAASVKCLQGGLVVLDTAGNAKPAVTATGLVGVGRCEVTADNSSGAAAAISVLVRAGVFQWVNGESITKTSIGYTAYAADDQTVFKTVTGKSPVGVIIDVDANGVWVETQVDSILETIGLTVANNLSDVASATTAATNLGLGTGSNPTFNNLTVSGTELVTGVATFTAAPVFSAGTASQTVELTAGKALTTAAITGTGSYVKSVSPTLTGTIAAANQTLSGTLAVTGVATFSNKLSTQVGTYTVSTPDVDGGSLICDLTDAAVITLPAIAAGNDGMKIRLMNTAAAAAAGIQYTVTGADRICGTVVGVTVTAASTLTNTKATAKKGDYASLVANNALKLWLIDGGVGVWA